MDIKTFKNVPEPYMHLSNFTEAEALTLQAVFSETVCLELDELFDKTNGEPEDLSSIPDSHIDLATLLEEDVRLPLEEVDSIRSLLMAFGQNTIKIIKTRIDEAEPHDYFIESQVPELVLFGKTARGLARQMAGRNTSAGFVRSATNQGKRVAKGTGTAGTRRTTNKQTATINKNKTKKR